MFNVENITHVQLKDDGGVVVFFIGGQKIGLNLEEAQAIYASQHRLHSGSTSKTTFSS